MSEFLYCRGCGKQLHSSAPACPNCGTPQMSHSAGVRNASPALGIISCIFGIILFLLAIANLDYVIETEDTLAAMLLFIPALVCGVACLVQKKSGKTAAIVGLVTASLGMIFLLPDA